jgi:hypothetical protein
VIDVDLNTIVEDTEAKTTNATASNNATTKPNPTEIELTSNNDEMPVKVEGQPHTSMLETNETSDIRCAPIDIDEDVMVIDVLCSLDDHNEEENDDASIDRFK